MPKLILLVAIALAPVAATADDEAGRAACKADAQVLCQGVIPGGGRIVRCLVAHQDKLSDACKQLLERYDPELGPPTATKENPPAPAQPH